MDNISKIDCLYEICLNLAHLSVLDEKYKDQFNEKLIELKSEIDKLTPYDLHTYLMLIKKGISITY
jgi:hypothetical protein